MCLAVVALGVHPTYSVVVAANRDEFHARPARAAAWWDDDLLAGRDLAAGGTWLGVTRAGRWALLTNIRDPSRHDPAAPSRGMLVPSVLQSPQPVGVATISTVRHGQAHNGFNLLAGIGEDALWASNRLPSSTRLAGGVHGLSNASLDVPWPKVVHTRDAVRQWAQSGSRHLDPLWQALSDRRTAPDEALPSTGVSVEWERLLSAPFIVGDGYGTRCSTLFTVDREGAARFIERSFDAAGNLVGEVDQRFAVASRPQSAR